MTAPTSAPLELRYAAVSDLGRHRKDNQDSGYAGEHLLVVADGVGGAAYGDVASATAVQVMRRLDNPPDGEMLPLLAGAVHRVHDRLAELVEADNELEGTSTTLTAVLFDGTQAALAHVGDSRAYLLHDDELRQLTSDHTFVQTLIDEGRISEDEARHHPHRNIILRAVDGVHDTEPDLIETSLSPGDRLLLCSDGCSGVLSSHAVARILRTGSVDHAAIELVRAALDAGTTDNVTVIVAEVVAAGATEDPESAMAATGPMLVGAAASQPRKLSNLGRGLFRGRQHDVGQYDGQHDTGELDPVEDPVDPEELRYAPRAPGRFPLVRRLVLILVPLLILGGLAWWAYDWSQRQYFVSADGPYVAVYRGVQLDLPVIDLATLDETSSVRLADLSEFNQQKVGDGIVASSRADADRIVDNLKATVPEPEPEPECEEPEPKKRDRDKPKNGDTGNNGDTRKDGGGEAADDCADQDGVAS